MTFKCIYRKCGKPLKPKTTVRVASDTGQNNSLVVPIPIVSSFFQSHTNLIIGYGSSHIITFENIVSVTSLFSVLNWDIKLHK